MYGFFFYLRSSELDTPGIDHGLDSSVLSTSNSNKSLNRSSSNPDLSISSISNKSNTSTNDDDTPTFVVKVYRSDQSYKYFPVLKDTTAKQLVMLAITEFNIGDQSRYETKTESLEIKRFSHILVRQIYGKFFFQTGENNGKANCISGEWEGRNEKHLSLHFV